MPEPVEAYVAALRVCRDSNAALEAALLEERRLREAAGTTSLRNLDARAVLAALPVLEAAAVCIQRHFRGWRGRQRFKTVCALVIDRLARYEDAGKGDEPSTGRPEESLFGPTPTTPDRKAGGRSLLSDNGMTSVVGALKNHRRQLAASLADAQAKIDSQAAELENLRQANSALRQANTGLQKIEQLSAQLEALKQRLQIETSASRNASQTVGMLREVHGLATDDQHVAHLEPLKEVRA